MRKRFDKLRPLDDVDVRRGGRGEAEDDVVEAEEGGLRVDGVGEVIAIVIAFSTSAILKEKEKERRDQVIEKEC